MLRYYITDRKAAGGTPSLLGKIHRAVSLGVEFIQVREKDLSARKLMDLIAQIQRGRTRVFVNGRFDIALSAKADGLHLPAGSLPPNRLRAMAPPGFAFSVSCHSVAEVLQAEREGANFAVLGPIFQTPSKVAYGEPLGLRVLQQAVHSTTLPVFALGGINASNQEACQRAGAAGIAGIRLFQG